MSFCYGSVKNGFDSAILTKIPKDEERRKGWVVDGRRNVVPSANPRTCPRTPPQQLRTLRHDAGLYQGVHNWTAYRPGTQFGYGGLRHGSLKMYACEMRARERATLMRYRHLRCTPIRCTPLRCMSAKETRP